MTKRRPITIENDHCLIPIGGIVGERGYAIMDQDDHTALYRHCGNVLSFYLKNGYVYIKWKGDHKSVARMILNARDSERVAYGPGGTLDLRRSNISKSGYKTPTIHMSDKLTERNRRKNRRTRGVPLPTMSRDEAIESGLRITTRMPSKKIVG